MTTEGNGKKAAYEFFSCVVDGGVHSVRDWGVEQVVAGYPGTSGALLSGIDVRGVCVLGVVDLVAATALLRGQWTRGLGEDKGNREGMRT